uniref:Candidate secreted effector n=1 Tax=Meloidogyne incognita TaxID=6306 RepID=A0A914NUY5_MELIC
MLPEKDSILLIGLLLVLAANIAFGRFLPAAVEQHNLRFKRAGDDIFLRDTKDWSKYGIAAGVYLVISLVIYVATFCCALEKNRAALGPAPPGSVATLSPVSSVVSSASTRTAKGQSEASMRTALQQSIRMDSRTQRETERAAASSRKSGKVSPSTRLPTASAKEQTASRKTTSARTSSARTESAGTTSKKSTSKATKSRKGTSSKGTTDTGKSTSILGRVLHSYFFYSFHSFLFFLLIPFLFFLLIPFLFFLLIPFLFFLLIPFLFFLLIRIPIFSTHSYFFYSLQN